MAKLADTGVSIVSNPEYTDLINLKAGKFMDHANQIGDLSKLDVEIIHTNLAHIARAQPLSKASLGLWHHRLSHISEETIWKMVQTSSITGIEVIGGSTRDCSACHKGKQT